MKITLKRSFIFIISYFFALSGYLIAGDKYKHISHDRELKHKAAVNEEPTPAPHNKIKTAAMAVIAVQPARSATAVWLDEQDDKKRLAEEAVRKAEQAKADLRNEISQIPDVLKAMLEKYTKFDDPTRLPLASIKKIIEKEIPADYRKITRLYELDTYNSDQKILGNFAVIEKVEKAIDKYAQKLLKTYNENNTIKKNGKFLKPDFARPLAPTEIDVEKIKAEALELVKKFSPKELNYPALEFGDEYEQQCDAYEKEEALVFSQLRRMAIESTRNSDLKKFIVKQYDLMKDVYQQNRLCYFHKRVQALEDYYENWLKNLAQDDYFPSLSHDDERYYYKIKKELEAMLEFDSNLCSRGSIEKLKNHVREALVKIKSYFEKIVEANNVRYDSAALARLVNQDPSLENYLKLREAFQKSLNFAKSLKNKKITENVMSDLELVEKRIRSFEEKVGQKDGARNQADQLDTLPTLNKLSTVQAPSNETLVTLTLPPVQNSSAKSTPEPKKPTHLSVPVRSRVATPRDQRSPSSKKKNLPPIAKKNQTKTLTIKPRSQLPRSPRNAS